MLYVIAFILLCFLDVPQNILIMLIESTKWAFSKPTPRRNVNRRKAS